MTFLLRKPANKTCPFHIMESPVAVAITPLSPALLEIISFSSSNNSVLNYQQCSIFKCRGTVKWIMDLMIQFKYFQLLVLVSDSDKNDIS